MTFQGVNLWACPLVYICAKSFLFLPSLVEDHVRQLMILICVNRLGHFRARTVFNLKEGSYG